MKKPPAAAAHSTRTTTVLCVDPVQEDLATLEEIFNSCPWSICPDTLWTLETSDNLKSAWNLLRTNCFPLVLCERDLRPGTWHELLELLERLPESPFLIVTSRTADERLWAEALNCGAYDVLAKPFDRTEVMRVVSMAWMHWADQHDVPVRAQPLAAGAL